MKHNIHVDNMAIGTAVRERLELHIAEITKHFSDPNVVAKPASITMTIKLQPDPTKTRLSYSVDSGTKTPSLAPYVSTMYVGVDKATGLPHAQDYDPNQMRIPLEEGSGTPY